MPLRFLLFPILIFLLQACSDQENTPTTEPSQAGLPIEPVQTADLIFSRLGEKDPNFQGTAAIHSQYGPKTITRNVMQDRNGAIWISTFAGLIQYDGEQFTNYTNRFALRRFRVLDLLEDRSGNLWFTTIGAGLYRYDGEKFVNFTTQNGLASDRVHALMQDRMGNIWIGTNGGISIYDGKKIRNITEAEGLPSNDVNCILEDRSGKIWVSTRGALSTYDGETFELVQKPRAEGLIPPTEKNAWSFSNVRKVIEDRQGNIWFGGQDGLWRSSVNGQLTRYTKAFVGNIMEDSQGHIWTPHEASGGWALSRYDASLLNDSTIAPEVILLEQNMFFGLTEDTEGNIWMGSLRGVGRYDGEQWDWFRE